MKVRLTVNVDDLRSDLRDECYGAYFGGGFGGAMVASWDIDNMSDEEVVNYAICHGVDIEKYATGREYLSD